MRRTIRLTALLVVTLSLLLISPSSMADSKGYWKAAYSLELPAGYWSTGTHTYEYEWTWAVPEEGSFSSGEWSFNVSDEAPLYTGYALLRFGVKVLTGPGALNCGQVDAIHPDQPARFLVGWVNDFPMTYREARAHVDSMVATVAWDGGAPVKMTLVQFPAPGLPERDCVWALRK